MKKSMAERLGWVTGMLILFMTVFGLIEGFSLLMAWLASFLFPHLSFGMAFLISTIVFSLVTVVSIILEGRANR